MVVEYIGEIIGQNVSNYREKHYEKHGVDMYMFRMGVDEIVDATFKGNMARFINHSCEVRLRRVQGEGGEGRECVFLSAASQSATRRL